MASAPIVVPDPSHHVSLLTVPVKDGTGTHILCEKNTIMMVQSHLHKQWICINFISFHVNGFVQNVMPTTSHNCASFIQVTHRSAVCFCSFKITLTTCSTTSLNRNKEWTHELAQMKWLVYYIHVMYRHQSVVLQKLIYRFPQIN